MICTSKNSTHDGRFKTTYGRKRSKGAISSPNLDSSKQKHSKSQLQHKKISAEDINEPQQAEVVQEKEKEQTFVKRKSRRYSVDTEEKILSDCVSQVKPILVPIKKPKTQRKNKLRSTDELIKNCNLARIKAMGCEKFNDCNFLCGNENSQSSKRLLFMQFNNKDIYINTSRQKSRRKSKTHRNRKLQSRNSQEEIVAEQQLVSEQPVARDKVFLTEKHFDDEFNKLLKEDEKRMVNVTYGTHQANYVSVVTSKFCSEETGTPVPPKPVLIVDVPIVEQSPPVQVTPVVPVQDYSCPLPIQYSYNMLSPVFQMQMEQINLYYSQLSLSCYASTYSLPTHHYSQSQKSYRGEDDRLYEIIFNNIENDGRTTVMIKNIPNKYTKEMLIDLYNVSDKNKYDFIYLPIDSDNVCNVGYGFINFLKCSYIKDFYLRYDGQKWDCFNSEKICKLSYAKMQGTCLSDHLDSKMKNKKNNNHSGYKNYHSQRR